MLWLCALAYGVTMSVAPEGAVSRRTDVASGYALPFIIAWWVTADARKRGRGLCYDYDSFIFFAWPFLVPIYLFQTRGIRAFLTLLCFAGIGLLAMIPIIVANLLAQFGP